MRASTTYLMLLALAGACRGELLPTGGDDDDDAVQVDAGLAGGADAAPAVALAFRPRIQSDLDTLGCTAGDCHGLTNTPMYVTAAPADDTVWMANYDQVEPRTGSPDTSLLIAKATGAGGHLEVVNTTSPVLVRWRDWIESGAPYQ